MASPPEQAVDEAIARINQILSPIARAMFSECHADSCEQAAAESGLSPDTFPPEPPFTLEQVLDPKYLPD
jgi:Domain of unknown function DUF29